MRSIHPFPARMAPDTVSHWLDDLPVGSRVLDPMCGSGVVIRQSALLGHRAMGFDIDPLAVLMSKVWTRKGSHQELLGASLQLLKGAQRKSRFSHLDLPWIARCPETAAFVEFWFAEPQRSALARLAIGIERLRSEQEEWVCDCLQLALSRIIVTKHVGASLAWDVSHSRPHRMRNKNDFDVFDGYHRAVKKLIFALDEEPVRRAGVVKRGDCRNLNAIKRNSIDAIVTSPPYLNAIDYLRGHKLALVWFGHTIPNLRNLRSTAIGTERSGILDHACSEATDLENAVKSIRRLPTRQRSIVHKYAQDARLMLQEMKRLLAKDGLMILVLGDSNLRGVPVYNSRIFRHIARETGFILKDERRRPLQSHRRYLPTSVSSGALANRMKAEVLQAYRLSPSA